MVATANAKATGTTTTTGKTGRAGRFKLIALAVITIAIVIGVQTGIVGYGWAHLRSSLFPRDEALLAYLPGTTAAVVIVDPHKLDMKALGEEQSSARTALERIRGDVKKTAGIDLLTDMDKIVLSPGLVVARGRFSCDDLEARLIQSRYVVSEHRGVRYLVRQGEDAIAAVDGSTLVYAFRGEADMKAAIDAEAGDESLGDSETVTRRLSQMGWDHAVLGTVQVQDERPSLRAVLSGGTGPRAFTTGIATRNGRLEISVSVEVTSASDAEELAKLLEEKRASSESLKGVIGEAAAQVAIDVAKSATIKAEPAASTVLIKLNLDPATQEKIAKTAQEVMSTGTGEILKAFRLYQLLVPSL